ncbi:hypothetical protein GALMADRAFT_157785 [Galerina marginata CBS 339.88]|uniref:Uncharacterized protein n=1 Tax=Galerina marginata (strain CBS 339.88) TaxID=685588 RepID=A0A067T235_GALM3|nr:hypothetical protein GALMADRAFT_157785 [Galerina marginata CBS 339.88]
MPVTFSPAKKAPKAFDSDYFSEPAEKVDGGIAARILKGACYQQYRQSDDILQSSFDSLDSEFGKKDPNIIPQSNGFVHTVTEAYNQHRALVIRPDDVWLAILTQFSAFLNANAEALRSQFVSHKGKKELVVKADRRNVDYGDMAGKMTKEIEKNVVDPVLRAWILPDFSTTTTNDTIVCSVVMMASMKEYFSYKFQLMCGIPRVTLDGEKLDWERILARLEKLKEYGLQAIAWYHLLRPVVARFVKAFDGPEVEENLDFWQKVAHYEGGGSGPTYLGGWITAFCVFDDKGKWLGHPFKENAEESPNARSLSSADFFSTYIDIAPVSLGFMGFPINISGEDGEEEEEQEQPKKSHLLLDGAQYHQIDSQDVPSGYSEVDVLLDDDGTEYKCMMVAGHVGMRIRSNDEGGARDTIEPVAGWWMFTKQPKGKFKDNQLEGDEETPADLDQIVGEEGGPTEISEKEVQKESKPQVKQDEGAGCCKCVVM